MTRGLWLTPTQARRLDLACSPIRLLLGGVYLVGSCVLPDRTGRPPRDIDVRVMVDEETWARHSPSTWALISDGLGALLEAQTGLAPIDCQVQESGAANAEHRGDRSALGMART